MLTTFNNFTSEITFSIASEKDLIDAFRLRDQKKLLLPAGLMFPLRIRSYFTWSEPSGVYTYLVYKNPNWDLPRAVAFKRFDRTGESTGRLCGWCHAYGSSDEVGMLSVAMNSNTSATYILCQNLRCIEKIEEAAALSGKHPEKWIDQLYQRIGLFFEGILNYKQE
ncbi:MAG: FBP domain-containing protein [Bdellovibrionaceae bacterium]|nr:FBP domain-containing protein [Bdellovibrio sp.]